MDENHLDFIFDQLIPRFELSPDFILFIFGGEPTLTPKTLTYTCSKVQKILSTGQSVRLAIQTNLYHPSALFDLIRQGIQFDAITVSLDGPEQIHDHYRKTKTGGGSFCSIMENLNCLLSLKNQFPNIGEITIEATVTQRSFPLTSILDFFRLHDLNRIILVNVLTQENGGMDLEDAKHEWKKVADYVFQHQSDNPPFWEGTVLQHALKILHPGKDTICPAGRDILAVTPSGMVYPCGALSNVDLFELGNIYDFHPGLVSGYSQTFGRSRSELDPNCSICAYNDVCLHKCFAANFYYSTNPNRFSMSFQCELERCIIDTVRLKLEKMYEDSSDDFRRFLVKASQFTSKGRQVKWRAQ